MVFLNTTHIKENSQSPSNPSAPSRSTTSRHTLQTLLGTFDVFAGSHKSPKLGQLLASVGLKGLERELPNSVNPFRDFFLQFCS
jgi:hypothetical protein